MEHRRNALATFEQDVLSKLPTMKQMAEDSFRAGQSQLIELLDATRARFEVKLTQVDMLEAVVQAEVDVLAVTGRIEETGGGGDVMPTSRHRLVSAAVAVLALPVAMGPGRCGFISDFTETFLFTEEIDRIVLNTDDGNIDAVAYDREGIFIRRHSFGYLRSFLDPVERVDGTDLMLDVHCKFEGNCEYDHMMEIPLGVALDITMSHALIDMGYVDSALEMTFETGYFYGVRLATPTFALTAEEADVDAEFVVAPETLTITLGTGDVVLQLPAGSYACNLDAAAGAVDLDGVTCDDAAAAILDVQVEDGDITITGSRHDTLQSLWRIVPLVLGLPLLGGASICGVVLVDIAQRDLIIEPITSISVSTDQGSIEVDAVGRNGTSLLYYMVGSLRDIGDVGHELDGDHLDAIAICNRLSFCNVNWTAEIPLGGIAVDIQAKDGSAKLLAVDGPVTADVAGGLEAVHLRSPELTVTVEAGDVVVDFVDAPTAVNIDVGEGNVELTLPPGSYRCDLESGDGEVDSAAITCDPAATSAIQISVGTGDIVVLEGQAP
ncbi:hypothetical protein [Nannocystis pusilla]|uniref:hypothetical protein n=1 Tax=Nannocystis pusilla TaxID=889268 RepID=UPI003B7964C4